MGGSSYVIIDVHRDEGFPPTDIRLTGDSDEPIVRRGDEIRGVGLPIVSLRFLALERPVFFNWAKRAV